MRRSLLLLAGDGVSTRVVAHALRREFGDFPVILEPKPTNRALVRRRIRRLGAAKTLGQIAFMVGVLPFLKRAAARRIAEIQRLYELDTSPLVGEVRWVNTVNSPETRAILRESQPDVVVVNGTRILDRLTLSEISCPIINTHAGITPLYRGVHGGYWALAEGRADLVGTTVHLIDAGIDTGSIIEQRTFEISADDNFATYPYLHIAAGLPLLISAVRAALSGEMNASTESPTLESRLRSHPTLKEYALNRFRRGVK